METNQEKSERTLYVDADDGLSGQAADAYAVTSPATGIGDDWAHPDTVWARIDGEWKTVSGGSRISGAKNHHPGDSDWMIVVDHLPERSTTALWTRLTGRNTECLLLAADIRAAKLLCDYLSGLPGWDDDLSGEWEPFQRDDLDATDDAAYSYLCDAVEECIGSAAGTAQRAALLGSAE